MESSPPWGGGWMGGLDTNKTVCVPQIALQFRAWSVDFLFPLSCCGSSRPQGPWQPQGMAPAHNSRRSRGGVTLSVAPGPRPNHRKCPVCPTPPPPSPFLQLLGDMALS